MESLIVFSPLVSVSQCHHGSLDVIGASEPKSMVDFCNAGASFAHQSSLGGRTWPKILWEILLQVILHSAKASLRPTQQISTVAVETPLYSE